MSQKASWTILVYIAAHNNLDWLGVGSRKQILNTGSSDAVKLAVLYDGKAGAERTIVGQPGNAAFSEALPNFDSGDGAALLETARWAYEHCPAERYGLVLWSHGSGWRPEDIQAIAREVRRDTEVDAAESKERSAASGSLVLFRKSLAQMVQQTESERAVLFDDGTGHSLDTLELAQVTEEVRQLLGQPLDLLGMDACLMASLEVAYQIRGSVRHLVASQELVPGLSWPYDTILGALSANPGLTSAELSTLIVQHYVDYYTAHPPSAGDVTKVAVDLTRLDSVVQAVSKLAEALSADINNQASLLWNAQVEASKQESRNFERKPTKFQYHLWDIASVITRLADRTTNQDVAAAARDVVAALQPGDGAILAEGHAGEWFKGIGGLTVYMAPPNKQRISPYYKDLAFAQNAHWQQLLSAYHEQFAMGEIF